MPDTLANLRRRCASLAVQIPVREYGESLVSVFIPETTAKDTASVATDVVPF
jgi:hypothetical protein